MLNLSHWVIGIVDALHVGRVRHQNWQKRNLTQELELKKERILAEKALEAELKQRSITLEHQIRLQMTRQSTDLAMLKTRCKQDLKDYQHYLESINRLKVSIRNSYTDLPEAIALTIHHHAKQLLHRMWDAEDEEQKNRYEFQLIRFMTAVHEDARAHLENNVPKSLPQQTLLLLNQQANLP